MTFHNLLIKNIINNGKLNTTTTILNVRYGHILRGKPPGVAKTIEQRLEEDNVEDPEIIKRINIGLPQMKLSRTQQLKERLTHLKKQRADSTIEKAARSNNLRIDLDEVQREYIKTTGPYQLRTIADHYGIFEDLFGAAFFIPRVPLEINYKNDDVYNPVYSGNIIKPATVRQQPDVKFDGTTDPITGIKLKNDCYWTLLATNPDANFTNANSEYIHWFVGNIPNGDINKADVLVDYLPPFPPKGIGYQRFIFILYKQNAKLDFSDYKLQSKDYANLEKRTFKTLDFYRKYQDDLTPAGLSFYQTNWDESITDFYHNILNMKEPIYEYDFPRPYLSEQKYFPLRQPFNLYMDKHRDIKQVNKEYLELKLSKTHPFNGPEKALRFPNAHPIRDVPSWLRTEIRKNRLGIGRINDYK